MKRAHRLVSVQMGARGNDSPAGTSCYARPALLGLVLFALCGRGWTAEPATPCFDVRQGFRAPLRPLIPPREDGDRALFGTYDDGTDWASTRALVKRPLGDLLAKLRDHRNVKDMEKTRLVVHRLHDPDYLDLCHVDVVVALRALFVKISVRWTEEWAYRLVEGTRDEPALVVANYQKIAGTSHIQHQCGSYTLRRLAPELTDLGLYEEVRASHRSAEDTRNMQLGILRNLREDRWPSGEEARDPRVQFAPEGSR